MSDITIRMVDPDDLTACHTIEVRSFPPSEAAWTSSLENRINYYPEGFLVAECNGEIVGQVNSGSTSKDDISDEEFKQLIGHDPDGQNIVIFSLSVLPEYRKTGVGSKLLSSFIDNAREMGKSKVLLICKDDLIPYYSKYGFQNAGPSASTHGGATWHEMVLPL
ncbi:GNAT family N-acetyltransferase [Pseudodesulfovibrio sp. zrk46]|uniref:GNAT family N-acetyltransferase n=1 Tax=Pseudodesulfovibrio sp. zrk46 TaxID=2725288 RepID=UPI00144A2208|nr:GNAT family N-acetyltransferase [Pseudodesulfovibrio sp. zrk46]QJB58135.1 GNAT family N-acetyltransferase [Pseudodesulfovibrio sp. zrk46]